MRVRTSLHLTGYLAVIALAGCGGGAASSPGMVPAAVPQAASVQPQSIAFTESGFVESFASTGSIGVRLSGETPVTNKHYGRLLGYAKGTVTKTTQVVTLVSGQSVVFHNVDTSLPHTASFLGDATKKSAPWPAQFDGSSSQSKAGTDISTPNFSTGAMSAGASSLTYVANVPGFYMFGCAFHYNSSGMRDIIIVR